MAATSSDSRTRPRSTVCRTEMMSSVALSMRCRMSLSRSRRARAVSTRWRGSEGCSCGLFFLAAMWLSVDEEGGVLGVGYICAKVLSALRTSLASRGPCNSTERTRVARGRVEDVADDELGSSGVLVGSLEDGPGWEAPAPECTEAIVRASRCCGMMEAIVVRRKELRVLVVDTSLRGLCWGNRSNSKHASSRSTRFGTKILLERDLTQGGKKNIVVATITSPKMTPRPTAFVVTPSSLLIGSPPSLTPRSNALITPSFVS